MNLVDYSVNLDPSFTQFISPQNSIPSQLPAITNIPDISNLPVTPITNSFFAYEAVDNTCLYEGVGNCEDSATITTMPGSVDSPEPSISGPQLVGPLAKLQVSILYTI